jgi:hypothetical protein
MRFRSAALLPLLLLAACPTAGMHRPSVNVQLAAASTSLRRGDTLRLSATVTNPSDAPLVLEFDAECVVVFYVRAPDGAVIHPVPEMPECPGARRVELAPGASQTYADAWVPADSLAAGEYVAYAIFGEHHVVRGEKRSFKAAHRSNEVPVRLEPRRDQ